jgi:hypothetical protein
MNLQTMMVAGRLRAVLERLNSDPDYKPKTSSLQGLLSPQQMMALEATKACLEAERFKLFEPHNTISSASVKWWEDCKLLRDEFHAWHAKRERMRKKKPISIAWNYRNLAKFNARATDLAARFENLSEQEQLCFVTKADPLYKNLDLGPSRDLSIALPYLRCGYEHRPELYDTARTAQIRTIASVLSQAG